MSKKVSDAIKYGRNWRPPLKPNYNDKGIEAREEGGIDSFADIRPERRKNITLKIFYET